MTKNRLTWSKRYVTCQLDFDSKMGSVSDLPLLQVPVGFTRPIGVFSRIHRFPYTALGAGYVTARGR